MECVPVPKRKRGRPPKAPRDNSSFPIDFPASHLPESNARQIQFGYRILQDILKLSKTKHLVDKPDENLFGLHDYYTVIQHPFWFNEVLRKFSAQEYTGINEVISDIRLVLENCYRFWGTKHRFSKQALRIEKLLEKELRIVPQNIRELCAITSIEEENNSNQENDPSFFVDDFNSKILKLIEKKEKEEAVCRKERDSARREEFLRWESEVLFIKQYKKQITFMPELAEIGQFLDLCHDVLCLKKVSQCEVERMLLIPRESTTLATVMTALLCPSAMRGSLYFKPVMVYEVWSKFLARKVDTWYNNFLKIGNKTQMFIRYGIETNFWEAAGEINPLINSDFSTLSFTKRVWIMKTLCTTLFHSYKKIEEYFNSVDEATLRGPVVYEDGKFDYISLFLPEIRVYRICRSEMDIDSKGEAIAIIPVKNGFPPDIQFQTQGENSVLRKRNKFHLAAHDTESLTSLIKVFSQKKKSLSALRGLLVHCQQGETKTLDALFSMKTQWEKYKERSPVSISNSIKYWIEKEISPPISPGENSQNLSFRSDVESFESRSSSDASVLGKRQLKRKFSLDEWENSSDSSIDFSRLEEDTSDWEEGNIRRKGKRKFRWKEPFPGDPMPRVNVMRPSVERCRGPRFGIFPPPMVNPLLQAGLQPLTPPFTPPAPRFASPFPQLATPNPHLASHSPQLASPSPQLASPSPQWASPSPQLTSHSQQLASPSPQWASPSPQLTSHPQQLALPTPQFSPHSPRFRHPFYQHPPPPFPLSRPSYGRGRGRGSRMRLLERPPMRKLVRRPSIVGLEISSSEVERADLDVLTISLNPPPPAAPAPPLTLQSPDLLLNDLEAIRIEPLPWIQGLD